LLGLTGAPVSSVELIHKGFVDVVDDGVEGEDGMLVDLAEQYLVVVGTTRGDLLTWLGAPGEVHTLTLELEFLTIGDEEILTSSGLLNTVTLVVDLVGLLVVDEDVGWANTLEPSLKDGLVGNI
jgi:hypothetical protein